MHFASLVKLFLTILFIFMRIQIELFLQISFSDSSLLVYINVIDFSVLIMYPTLLLRLFISLKCLLFDL